MSYITNIHPATIYVRHNALYICISSSGLISAHKLRSYKAHNASPCRHSHYVDFRRECGKVGLGGHLSESVWGFLDLLAELRPRHFGRATPGEGILASNHVVAKRIRAYHARRELQRQLPQGVKAKWFVQTIHGEGYRMRSDVRIRGRGEVGLQFRESQEPDPVYPQHEEKDGNTSEKAY